MTVLAGTGKGERAEGVCVRERVVEKVVERGRGK